MLDEVDAGGLSREQLEEEAQRLRERVSQLETAQSASRRRLRSVLAAILAVWTAVGVTVAAGAVWVHDTAFETEEFIAVVGPPLASDEVAAALSTRLTGETLNALALEERIAELLSGVGDALAEGLAEALELDQSQVRLIETLPIPGLEQLAAPIAGGLEERLAEAIDRFVTSEEFRTLLVEATRTAHEKSVALIRGDADELPNLVLEQGEVRLDLVPVVARVLADLVDEGLASLGIEEIPLIEVDEDPEVALSRLATALDVELDPDFGKLTVMSEEQLAELQDAGRAADRLVWVILVVTILLAGATLLVAPNRRRAVVQVALGAVGLTALTVVLIRRLPNDVAEIAATPQGGRAARTLADSVVASLRSDLVVVLVAALAVAVLAYLLGRPAWLYRTAGAMRRATASKPGGSDVERFVAAHHDLLRVGVAALALLLLAGLGITFLSLVVVAVLVAAALWALGIARDRGRGEDTPDQSAAVG